MKVRDVLKRLKREGWYLDHTTGDHRQFKHPTTQGTVTVSGKTGEDLKRGTLHSIYHQAGWGKP